MSQKGVENSGDQAKNENNDTNSENSNISHESQCKITIKNNHEFIYSTPIKRIRKKIFFPSTPKKQKRAKKHKGLIIQGRNLSSLLN